MYDCLIVIVTHNSEKYIDWCVEPFDESENVFIKIVDSGSTDISYLTKYKNKKNFEVIYLDNVGFAKANNVALTELGKYKFVLFLNPDARIEKNTFDSLLSEVLKEDSGDLFSLPLIKYDFDNKKATNTYDSTGIYCDVIGRWKDDNNLNSKQNHEAICGAFILVRSVVLMLEKNRNKSGGIGFEESYFMYKEDIELCLRINRSGSRAMKILKNLQAYHCRGWNKERSKVPYWAKYQSAVNDLDIAQRYKWRALPFAITKYIFVKHFEKENK